MSAAPERDGPPDAGQDPRRWLALVVCLVGVFMTLLDVSIVNVALPSLEQGLGASSSQLQWVLSGYAVTFGLALVPAGRLGDARSRRTVLTLGLSGFVLASVGCGLATTPTLLVVARLVQGLFAGAVTPQVTGIIQDLFRGPERGRAFGWFGATAGVSTAVGPLLGGALIVLFGDEHGWRFVFFVNLPIGLAAVPLAWRLLGRTAAYRSGSSPSRGRSPSRGSSPSRHRAQLDPLGSVLLGVAVVALLLPLVQQQEWSGSVRYPLFGVAAVFLAAFLLWERAVLRRDRTPVIDLRLFRLETYTFGSAIALVYFASFTSIFFVLALYLQQGQGYPAWQAGLTVTSFALLSIPGSRVSGHLSQGHAGTMVRVGSLLVAAGLVAAIVAAHLGNGPRVGWWLAVPLAVAGFGSGFVLPSNQTRTVSQVPVDQASSAGGAYQTFQRIGTAIGIALVGTVFYNGVASGGLPVSGSGGGVRPGAAVPQPVRDAFTTGFERGIAVAAGFAVLTFLLALVEGLAHRRRTRHAGAEDVRPPAHQPSRPAHVPAEPVSAEHRSAPGEPEHGRHNAQHPEDLEVRGP